MSEKKIDLFFLLLWTIFVIIASFHHEIWRDEMRAFSIAIDCKSIWNLPYCLKNEGHPILWYLLLKIGYSLCPSSIVLKVVAVLIGLISGWLFMYCFNIPIVLKRLYLFSNFMFWENSIMCRNYGIASFLIVVFSIVYDRKNVFAALLVLSFLIQTNVIGMIAALCLFTLIFVDIYQRRLVCHWGYIVVGSISFILSLLLFYNLTKPSPISNVTSFHIESSSILLHQIFTAMLPGNIMPKILDGQLVLSITILLLLILYFIRNKWYLLVIYFAYVMIHFIDKNVYDIDARHLGVFFMFIVFMVHRHSNDKGEQNNKLFEKIENWSLNFFYPMIFLVLVVVNLVMCLNDYRTDVSSSKAFAKFIYTVSTPFIQQFVNVIFYQ